MTRPWPPALKWGKRNLASLGLLNFGDFGVGPRQ